VAESSERGTVFSARLPRSQQAAASALGL
jgi:hypothetical protein